MENQCDFCGGPIDQPRKGKRFCSDAHRTAFWRDQHLPRCPHCGGLIEVAVTAILGRSERTGD